MADWKVSAEKIDIFPHPNADNLQIAKVGMFSLVVNKQNGYKSGDVVVFTPKRSLLPPDLTPHYINPATGKSYLGGQENNRVNSVRMRGELSEGITIGMEYVLSKLELDSVDQLQIGQDISDRLGITLYEPPIPASMAGQVQNMRVGNYTQHDVEGMNIYADQFEPNETVIATEKIHGSQIAVVIDENGNTHVSSKGLFSRGQEILEDDTNLYWRALKNSGLIDALKEIFGGRFVQAFGEAIPAQGGNWTYGIDPNKPTLRLFRLEVDKERYNVERAHNTDPRIKALWTPVIYQGPFDLDVLREHARGQETVSGKNLHIREGIVVEPLVPRMSTEKFPLYLKLINPKFKDSDDTPS